MMMIMTMKKVTALLMRESSLMRTMILLYQRFVKQQSCLENHHLKMILFKTIVELIYKKSLRLFWILKQDGIL